MSSDSDSEEFNGEFNPKLPASFKIPLKTTPKKLIIDADKGQADGVEEIGPTDEYTSPLQIVEESLSENNVEPDENIIKHETPNRKRKPSPSTAIKKSSPKESKPPSLRLPGRSTEFPDELNELLQPLSCNLCKAPFTSIKVSWTHYDSKSHLKKITAWLAEWTKTSGESMPKIPKLIKEGTAGPNPYHCEACNLPLTSLLHANQHYSGKRHKMVVQNRSKPSGSGYYDSNGKWVRTPTKIITDSRYGIGGSFQKPSEEDTKQPPPENPKKTATSTRCEVCNIDLSSDGQMQDHLKGSKHAKKLKQLEKPPYLPEGDTVLASANVPEKDDMSMYRTPTGSYYCKTCDFSLLDPSQMRQHLSGKRHAKNLKKQPPSEVNGGNNAVK